MFKTTLSVLCALALSAGSATAQTGDPELEDLIDAALADGWAYERLQELCDEVGPRLAGSPGMEMAKEWSRRSMMEAGFDSIWMEEVTVPHWTRGREWARVTAPMEFELEMIGLGLSDGSQRGYLRVDRWLFCPGFRAQQKQEACAKCQAEVLHDHCPFYRPHLDCLYSRGIENSTGTSADPVYSACKFGTLPQRRRGSFSEWCDRDFSDVHVAFVVADVTGRSW